MTIEQDARAKAFMECADEADGWVKELKAGGEGVTTIIQLAEVMRDWALNMAKKSVGPLPTKHENGQTDKLNESKAVS